MIRTRIPMLPRQMLTVAVAAAAATTAASFFSRSARATPSRTAACSAATGTTTGARGTTTRSVTRTTAGAAARARPARARARATAAPARPRARRKCPAGGTSEMLTKMTAPSRKTRETLSPPQPNTATTSTTAASAASGTSARTGSEPATSLTTTAVYRGAMITTAFATARRRIHVSSATTTTRASSLPTIMEIRPSALITNIAPCTRPRSVPRSLITFAPSKTTSFTTFANTSSAGAAGAAAGTRIMAGMGITTGLWQGPGIRKNATVMPTVLQSARATSRIAVPITASLLHLRSATMQITTCPVVAETACAPLVSRTNQV
mmetsp:Transcript_6584/g.12849  ORF Transcript_6584/g.12849 Transcript_6584/m.12849 type:complete len:322 (+) Transcript_6584:261-1226(+)